MAQTCVSRGRPGLRESEALAVPLLIPGIEEHQLRVVAAGLHGGPVRRLIFDKLVHVLHGFSGVREPARSAGLAAFVRIASPHIEAWTGSVAGKPDGVVEQPAGIGLPSWMGQWSQLTRGDPYLRRCRVDRMVQISRRTPHTCLGNRCHHRVRRVCKCRRTRRHDRAIPLVRRSR